MTNKPVTRPKTINVEFTVVEALAIIKAAELGAAIHKEMGTVRSTTAMTAAIRKVAHALPAR
jgi:hypothetical protein